MNKKRNRQIKRLLTLFLAVCSSLFAVNANAQDAAITLRLVNVSMEHAMDEIEKQSDFLFLSARDVDINTTVTVNVDKQSIAEALAQMLRGTNIIYKIEGKQIILSRDEERPPVTVKGVVTDPAGRPLVSAVVVVKGTLTGTTTATDGSFTVKVPFPTSSAVLTVTYLGYETVEVAVGDRTELRIAMKNASVMMQNVVVTALGIRRAEKALAYNVQQIASYELNTVKSSNFVNSLAGKVAGVQINASAGPGASVRIVARGEKSIEQSNTVLYVIDGIPMYNHSFGGGGGTYGGVTGSEGIADINPEDIESINMLTGPSAAALYGSAAANGVILVNTKRGEEGRTTVTVSNSTVFSKTYMMPRMQNTYGTSVDFNNWGGKYDSSAFDPRDFFNTGANIINSVALSTGNARNQTYLSAATTNSTGIVPGNRYGRYNFTARNTTKFLNDKMTLDLGAGFILQNDRNMVAQGIYFNPLPSLYLFPRSENFNEARMYERYDPTMAQMTQFWPYGANGNYHMQNPYWIQNRMNRESNKQRYMLNASLSYDIFDWLSVVGRVRVDNSDILLTRKLHAGTEGNFADPLGGYSEDSQKDRSFYGDAMVNIDYTFGKFTLNANLGASIEDQRFHQIGGAGNLKTSPNEFVYNNLNFSNKYRPISGGWTEQTQSVFASVELGWDSMLYLTATARNEWASQLAWSNQSSFFYPSVGLSGVLSNMFDAPEWLSFLKVRGSYSQVGSAYKRYLSHPGNDFSNESHEWSNSKTLPHTDLKPEMTNSWEAGLDARFFGGKLTVNATWYRSNTLNQTLPASVPASSGYTDMIVQAGDIQNEGIELTVGYRNRWHDFGWTTSYTFTSNRNTVKDLGKGVVNPVTGVPLDYSFLAKDWLGSENVAPQVRLVVGGSMSDIYVNQQIKRDNDGYVDMTTGSMSMESVDFRKVGQLRPKATMAWSNNFSYSGFDLGVIVSARMGGVVYSATQGALDYFGTSQVTADRRDKGGIPVNFGSIDPQEYYQTIATPFGGYGGYYIYDATNVRLQELSLNYSFPKKWFRDKIALSLGFVARNLAMIWCKAPFDPEISPSTTSTYYQGVDFFGQPSVRELGFNVKLSF